VTTNLTRSALLSVGTWSRSREILVGLRLRGSGQTTLVLVGPEPSLEPFRSCVWAQPSWFSPESGTYQRFEGAALGYC
jgi:hypothetical protein